MNHIPGTVIVDYPELLHHSKLVLLRKHVDAWHVLEWVLRLSNWASATTSNECVTSIMFSSCVTFDPDWAWWVAQSITERLRKCNHHCMTFKHTHCFALYWALIWIYADAGLNLATCPFIICYIKQHSSSKKSQSSVRQRCLLWWMPTEHIGQHLWMLSYFVCGLI